MWTQEKNHGAFDFIFVDADKDNYINYHKRLIDLVKVGGVIGYDNTLWNGSVVAPPDAPLRKYVRYYRDFVLELNKALAADPRIEICMLPVGDGITICRRIKWVPRLKHRFLFLIIICFLYPFLKLLVFVSKWTLRARLKATIFQWCWFNLLLQNIIFVSQWY